MPERPRTDPANARTVHLGFDSHIGRAKILKGQINQDCVTFGRLGIEQLVVVADGISVCDVGRGDLASRIATTIMRRTWESLRSTDIGKRLARSQILDTALDAANRAICDRSSKLADGHLSGRAPMGTTVVTALIQGATMHLAWMGDSRAYLVGPAGPSLLTADDNLSADRFGSWCDQKLRSWNSNGHGLVRYLGHFDETWSPRTLPARHAHVELRPGERVVLCTDGVTDFIAHQEAEIAKLVGDLALAGSPDEAAAKIVQAANRGGGGDNISVVVLAWSEAEAT
jgi:protein phosphatase